ncbi:MAG: phage tail length tape measure family protein, partial [Shewanella sp.]
MTTELRSTTFTIKVNVDGKEKIVEVTRAVSDLDGAEKSIKATLGDVASVTTSVTKSQKELNQQARVAVTEAERQHKQTKRVVDEYKNLNKALTMSAEDAQVFNAQMRAGVDPMSAQGQQIAKLVKEHQQLAAAQGNQQGSLRNARGVMQNFGWQMQDTIVQLQMGTSAFTVLSQQGSQMAAAFGPTGAIVGAFIALSGVVGGSLFAGLLDTKTATEKFKEKTDELAESLKRGENNNWEYSDSLREIARASESAGNSIAALARLKLVEALTLQAKSAGDSFVNMGSNIKEQVRALTGVKLNSFFDMKGADATQKAAMDAVRSVQAAIADMAVNKDVAAIDSYIAALSNLVDNYASKMTPAARLYIGEQLELAAGMRKTMGETDGLSASTQQYISQLAKGVATMKMSTVEKRLHEAALLDLDTATKQSVMSMIVQEWQYEQQVEAEKEAAKSKENLVRKLESEYRARESIRKQIESAQNRQFKKDDPRSGENEQYAENIKALNEQYKVAESLGQAGLEEKKRINALIEAENSRHLAAIKGMDIKDAKDLANEKLAITKSIYGDMKEFALVERDAQYLKELAMAQKHGLNLRDVMANYQKDVADIEARYNDEKKSGLDAWLESTEKALGNYDQLVEQSLDRFTSGFGDAFANSIMGAESVGDAFKGMFEGMASSMLKYFGEWAAQEIAIWALKKLLGEGAGAGRAESVAAFGAEEVNRAALSAFASTAAIPVVGPAMAPAAASTAAAIASPMALAMSAAAQSAIPTYDKGGVIPTKGYGIVSEFGDELVGGTLVYNNTPNGLNVTG